MPEKPKRFYASLPSGKATVITMSAAAAALHGALQYAIEDLAVQNEGRSLDWFDDLHRRALRNAKGTITDGVPIQVEAEALQYGVDVVDAALKAIRARLVSEGRED